jgi:hypothetical protein
VYYIRLQRDGWALRKAGPGRGGQVTNFEKRVVPHWILRKLAYATLTKPGTGCYFDEHQLVNTHRGRTELPGVGVGRLRRRPAAVGRGRTLYAGSPDDVAASVPLLDFTPLRFENLTAPY